MNRKENRRVNKSGPHSLKRAFRIPRGFERRRYMHVPAAALFDPRLARTPLLRTLMVICACANKQGETFVSQEGIGEVLGISKQVAGRYYLELLRLGYVERVAKRGRGYVTRVNFAAPWARKLEEMADLDMESIAATRRKLDAARDALEAWNRRA